MKKWWVNRDLPQWIWPCFIILAIVFMLTPGKKPVFPEAVDAKAFLVSKQVRDPSLEPVYKRKITSSIAYECNDCHRNFLEPYSIGTQRRIIGEHTQIQFKHGGDNLCFNCHNRENRMVLRAADGSDLPFNRAVELCINCHGVRYRDWKLGLHGKTTGYWDPEKQKASDRLQCLDCHSPHSPGVHDLKPAPAPTRPGPIRGGSDEVQEASHKGSSSREGRH